jgi:hypothetical protein
VRWASGREMGSRPSSSCLASSMNPPSLFGWFSIRVHYKLPWLVLMSGSAALCMHL